MQVCDVGGGGYFIPTEPGKVLWMWVRGCGGVHAHTHCCPHSRELRGLSCVRE